MTKTIPETFAGNWIRAVAAFETHSFLIFQDEHGAVTSWTYREFDEVVQRTLTSLTERGLKAGDTVHVALRNSPAFIALWLASSQLGARFVPVDPAASHRDITSQVNRVTPTIGFCAADRAEAYTRGVGECDHTPPVVELEETPADVKEGGPLCGAGRSRVGDAPAPSTPMAVMFTSGTTSQPKGVVLTQANYAHVAHVMSSSINLQSHHRWLVTLPLFHANAQYYCFSPAIAVGASVALTATFSASRWVQSAHDLGATHASLFAAPIRMILARTPSDAPQLALEHVWFAQSLGQEHHQAFAELAGTPPRQLYGMTETVAIVTCDRSNPAVHNVIGLPVADRRVRITDSAGSNRSVRSGDPGMLEVRGTPGLDLFLEYLDDPSTTARSMQTVDDETWFTTGDLVSVTPSGALEFVGRADDVIKVAGENVSLTEVEATLAQAPGVLEVAVVAVPDPVRDQVPVAYVVPADPEDEPDIADLIAWAETELPPSARPREWHLIAQLPRTSVGKVRRFAINADPEPTTDAAHPSPIQPPEKSSQQ